MIEHAADCMANFNLGPDGRTPFQRLRGKQCTDLHLSFGEKVLYQVRAQDRGKAAPRCREGIWLGKRWGTTEHLISDVEDRSIKTATRVARVPIDERWDRAAVQGITALPWDVQHRDGFDELAWRPFDPEGVPHTGPTEPTSYYITSADLRTYHHTAVVCQRCKALLAKQPAAGLVHSAACRTRLEGAMEQASDPRYMRWTRARGEQTLGPPNPTAPQPAPGTPQAMLPLWNRQEAGPIRTYGAT